MRTVDRIRVHAPFVRVFAVASRVTRWPAILPHYRWVRIEVCVNTFLPFADSPQARKDIRE